MTSSPSAPTPTPPTQTAATQQAYNTGSGLQSQAGSMVNQYNPYGSLNYSQTGTNAYGQPIYSANTSLSPVQQGLYNSLTGTQQLAGNEAQGTLASGNYGGANNIVGTTNSLTNQQMGNYLASVQPEMDRQTEQLDTQLRNQGIDPSSPAYVQAMQNLQQTQGQTVAGAAAQFQPQAYQEAVQSYQLPMQTAEQLAQFGSPTSPTSSFTNTPSLSIQPANYTGAVASADQVAQQDYQAQLQQQSAMLNAIFSPISALAGGWAKNTNSLSDANLKEDRKRANGEDILRKLRKIPVDHYRYKDEAQRAYGVPERRTGPMAQDIREQFPEMSDGHTVDFFGLLGHMLAAMQALEERTRHLVKE
jgi:hypothetical protein